MAGIVTVVEGGEPSPPESVVPIAGIVRTGSGNAPVEFSFAA